MLYIKKPDETIEYLVFKNGRYIKMYKSITYVILFIFFPFIIGFLSSLLDLELYVITTNIILYFLVVIFSLTVVHILRLFGIIKKFNIYDNTFVFDFFENVIKKQDRLHQISGLKYIAKKYRSILPNKHKEMLLLEEYIFNPELKTELLFSGGLYDYLMSLNKKV